MRKRITAKRYERQPRRGQKPRTVFIPANTDLELISAATRCK